MMQTLIWARLALPNTTEPLQADFAACVEGNRIIATGPREELRSRYPHAQECGGDQFLLLPAFVNSHEHGRGLGSATLGVPDDLLEIWLPGLATQPAIDPYLAAAYDGLLLLRSGVGTTTHSHNPRNWLQMAEESEATLRGYRDAGIRVAYYLPMADQNYLIYDDAEGFLADLPPDARALAAPLLQPPPLTHAAYVALCADLFDRCHDAGQHTVHIQISPVGGQWCSDELILAAVDFARQRGTRVQMHMLETRYQRQYAYRRWRKSFIQHLDEIGALGPWLTLAHMVWVDPDDLPLLAERGVGVAHNPSSNLRLRSGIAPVPDLLGQGVAVGIGLDGHGLDDDQDYLRELRLAWTLANRPGAAAPTVTPNTIMSMGTRDGAAITLGANVPLGGLEPGALADLVLIDVHAALGGWMPQHYLAHVDPLAVILRRASRAHVRHVMVNGRWVVRDGQSITLDEQALMAALRDNLARQDYAALRQHARTVQTLTPYLRHFYAQWEETN